MRIIFMGTPDFAATILENIVQHHEVIAVYSRPDAIRGRGKTKEASPVKKLAEQLDIPVWSPATLSDQAVVKHIQELAPDIICVAAYGALLPVSVLAIPPYGCVNVHASLLPRWRGAAPIERAILADDEETGVCIMRMDEGLDTGDCCICRTAHIEEKSFYELSDELADLGSHALLTALVHIEEGAAEWLSQDNQQASYAEKIEKSELNISPKDTARKALLKVRASSDAHASRCTIAGRSVRVLMLAEVAQDDQVREALSALEAGQVAFVHKRLFLGMVDDCLEVCEVKPDGKQAMKAQAFAAGVQNIKNSILSWEA